MADYRYSAKAYYIGNTTETVGAALRALSTQVFKLPFGEQLIVETRREGDTHVIEAHTRD